MRQDKKELRSQLVSIVAEVAKLPRESVKYQRQKELKELLKGLNQRYLLIAYVEADMGIRFFKQEEDKIITFEDLFLLVSQKLDIE